MFENLRRIDHARPFTLLYPSESRQQSTQTHLKNPLGYAIKIIAATCKQKGKTNRRKAVITDVRHIVVAVRGILHVTHGAVAGIGDLGQKRVPQSKTIKVVC